MLKWILASIMFSSVAFAAEAVSQCDPSVDLVYPCGPGFTCSAECGPDLTCSGDGFCAAPCGEGNVVCPEGWACVDRENGAVDCLPACVDPTAPCG